MKEINVVSQQFLQILWGVRGAMISKILSALVAPSFILLRTSDSALMATISIILHLQNLQRISQSRAQMLQTTLYFKMTYQ